MKKVAQHKPKKSLASLLGILPDLDLKKIYEEHDREVELEDEEDRKFLLHSAK